MKIFFFSLLVITLLFNFQLRGQEPDVVVIPGDIPGILETTINGDTTETGDRFNPNRIYELESGEIYIQQKPIIVDNPNGTITIRGQLAGKKPIIVKQPIDGTPVGTNYITANLTIQNIHYHGMELDGNIPWELWHISGENRHLIIENSLFENDNGIIFLISGIGDCEKIQASNCYFRDLCNESHWWGSRVIQSNVPVDTLIFENNTVTGGGLTIRGIECLFDYSVINHNTFINNHKYPFINQFWKEIYLTNNLFINVNMVGEDIENVANGGQDPDALLHGISGLDTIENTIIIPDKYLDNEGNLTSEIDELSDIIYYAADNVVICSSTLDNYYNGGFNDIGDYPVSYLTWAGYEGPFQVRNVPGIWHNERTQALIESYDNIIDENNIIYELTIDELGLATDPLPQEAADVFIQWNRNQWEVPGIEMPTNWSAYHFGDHDPLTIPGIETENANPGEAGITKISDLVEDFSYTADLISKSDGLRIGALHWFDEKFDSDASTVAVKNAYNGNINISACDFYISPSGKYLWDSSGIYTDTIPSFEGGDSIININLTLNKSTFSNINTNGCNGIYTSPSGKLWTEAGIYKDTIANSSGCDSIITINLTMNKNTYNSVSILECDSYISPNGKLWTESGIYIDTVLNFSGCDSIITFNLTINSSTDTSFTITACNSVISPNGKVWIESGTYTDTIPNSIGCDSIITFNITIQEPTITNINNTICDGETFSFGARTINSSGLYYDTLQSNVGCDSIIILNLTVSPKYNTQSEISICPDEIYTFGSQIITHPGDYVEIFHTKDGCDSTVNLNLNIINVDTSVIQNGATLMANATDAGYQWLKCEGLYSTTIDGETGQTFTASESGEYALMVSQNSCTGISPCLFVTVVSAEEEQIENLIEIHPNPIKDKIIVNPKSNLGKLQVLIFNATGVLVKRKLIENSDTFEINISEFPTGFYSLVIQTKNNYFFKRIIKEY